MSDDATDTARWDDHVRAPLAILTALLAILARTFTGPLAVLAPAIDVAMPALFLTLGVATVLGATKPHPWHRYVEYALWAIGVTAATVLLFAF